jgi:acyl carrier protein
VNLDETSPAVVLQEISRILARIREEHDIADGIEITMDSTFEEDLELESIDLVELAGQLETRYGSRVNFAEFIADLDLDEIIELTVGRLVDFVVVCLRRTPSGGDAIANGNEER